MSRHSERQPFNNSKFVEHLKVDEKNLSNDMSNIADFIGFYGYQEVLWDSTIKNLKLQLELKENQLVLDLKGGTEKYTVAQQDAFVGNNTEVQKFKTAILQAEEEKRLYTVAVNSLHEKAKQIQSLSARERSERGLYGGLHVETKPSMIASSPYAIGTGRLLNSEVGDSISSETREEIIKRLGLGKMRLDPTPESP